MNNKPLLKKVTSLILGSLLSLLVLPGLFWLGLTTPQALASEQAVTLSPTLTIAEVDAVKDLDVEAFKNQAQGMVDKGVGKAQKNLGATENQIKGTLRETKGKAQQQMGKAQSGLSNAGDKLEDTSENLIDKIQDIFD
ncbi:MAG: hypothetical protein WA919_15180 [Coleofasciculaceae cyanobacterium]